MHRLGACPGAHKPKRVRLQSLTSSNANQNTTTVTTPCSLRESDLSLVTDCRVGRYALQLLCWFVAKSLLFLLTGERSVAVLVSCKVKLCFFGTTLSLPTVAEPNLETKLDSSRSTFAREENLTVSHRLQFFFVERGTKKLVFERLR